MTNGIASETNGIPSEITLLPCGHCGGEVSVALYGNEFDEYWWSVQRGYDDETACKCRLFMESDEKFSLEEGEKPEDSPLAMELKARLVEKWNTRVAVTDHDFAMAVYDAETIRNQQERIAELEGLVRAHESGMRIAWAEYEKRDALIRDMHRECTACGYSCRTDSGECGIIQRIRELGIEVDA